jgi:uncharacterized protein (DUF3820 family)
MPASTQIKYPFISVTYPYQATVAPRFLHDLYVFAIAECTYCLDSPQLDMRFCMEPEKLKLLVVREMPFGKYQGRLLADLPGDYLNWFARQGFPAGELGSLLALMHEIDHNGLSALLDPLRTRPREPLRSGPSKAPIRFN